jgi:hypothetical protein
MCSSTYFCTICQQQLTWGTSMLFLEGSNGLVATPAVEVGNCGDTGVIHTHTGLPTDTFLTTALKVAQLARSKFIGQSSPRNINLAIGHQSPGHTFDTPLRGIVSDIATCVPFFVVVLAPSDAVIGAVPAHCRSRTVQFVRQLPGLATRLHSHSKVQRIQSLLPNSVVPCLCSGQGPHQLEQHAHFWSRGICCLRQRILQQQEVST